MKKIVTLLLTVLMAMTVLGGCAKKQENEESVIEADETKSADIIIVGAGGAGLSAAVEAINDGAKSVIIIEKTSTTGGSLNYTSGSMSGAETNIQKIDGIEDSIDSYVADIMKNGAGLGKENLIRAYAEEDVAAIQWLWDNGMSDNKYSIDRATGTMNVFAPEHALYSQKRTVKPSPDDAATYKSAAHEILDTVVKTMEGVTIDFGSEAYELVANKDGQVLTVLAKKDGKVIRYDATNAVIMATGGYSGNAKMLAAYTEHGGSYLPGGASTADVYGIYMMQQVGAMIEEESMSYVPTFPMGLDTGSGPGEIRPTYTWKAGGICVNQEGNRFVDETEDQVEVREVALEQQTDAVQYDIFSSNIVEYLTANPMVSVFYTYFFADGMPYSKYVVSADSLEELAEKIGVPAENLVATVENYNAHVESGEPDEFGRQFTEDSLNSYNVAINKIEGDKYYAVALKALCVMTLGGVSINENAQVLDTEGNVIPGLYAAGECTNVWGRFVSGGTGVMGPIVFGRLAARHAVANTPETGYTLKTPETVITADLFVKEEKNNMPTFDMSTKLNDGEYSATVDGQEGPMTVKTTITDGKISAVEIVEQHESSFTADAQETIPAKIVESNSLDVDSVAGASLTSGRIVSAVKDCLEQASK